MSDKVNFDENGWLTPYDVVSLDWNEFVETFGLSDVRRQLLVDYQYLISRLTALIPTEQRHWVDGSFVSKKHDPGDLDVVIFIDTNYFGAVETDTQQLKRELKGRVDCYFVETFPQGHRKYSIGLSDELTWYHFFRADRRKRKKGFVELKFGQGYGN